ncbi:MAG TPA: LptF/LptG family permease [Gemmatimonadales bacterium]|jgi:lipopolysaccharide export system permease protein
MKRWVLDRYLLREWSKIFLFTALGFPLIVILFQLTDNLASHLARGLTPATIASAYFFDLPNNVFQVLPAAVLFATVFSIAAMARHSEIVASTAAGRSFRRTMAPLLLVAAVAAAAGLVIGELAPNASRRKLEMLGEIRRSNESSRHNFVYRAEEGWSYGVRSLNIPERLATNLVMEREGSSTEYPTLAIQARRASYDDSAGRWTLVDGRMRILGGTASEIQTFGFDSMRVRQFTETPEDLLVEEKRPEEMRYTELGRYIAALERSGGDGRKLRVGQALKIAVPFTCIIIALFGGPMVMTTPRASGAAGIAISLGTTIVFLTLVQLSRALGTSGLMNPTVAAWIPNAVFGVVGLALYARVRT